MIMDGNAHNITCTSNFAAMNWDPACTRCRFIKRVVFLRRKTIAQGASPQEEAAALELADSLREKYGLTRGEIFDRQFEPVPTKLEAPQVFKKPPPRGRYCVLCHSGNRVHTKHIWAGKDRIRAPKVIGQPISSLQDF